MRSLSNCVTAVFSMLLFAAPALSDPVAVERLTLENGMQFILLPRDVEPGRVTAGWMARVGSAHERPGRTGVNHAIEHLWFRARTTRAGTRLYRDIGAMGINALTSYDHTIMAVTLPSGALQTWAETETERLLDRDFSMIGPERDALAKERGRRLTPDRFREQFDALFWLGGPYAWPPIGYELDVNALTAADLTEHAEMYYGAANLYGLVVGDFDIEVLTPILRSTFGQLPTGPDLAPARGGGMRPQAEQRLLGADAGRARIEVRYRTARLGHEDEPAVQMLAAMLNGPALERLVPGTVNAQVRAAGLARAGSFQFRAEVADGSTPAEVEAAWQAVVDRLQTDLVDEADLERVRAQAARERDDRVGDNRRLLMQLGAYEAIVGWEHVNIRGEALQAVTAEQVRTAAQTYLVPERRSVALIEQSDDVPARTPLDDLNDRERAQVQALLDRLNSIDDIDTLRSMLPQFEMTVGFAPENIRPAMTYVVERLRERLAELEAREGG